MLTLQLTSLYASFCLLLLCIAALVTNDNHRLYEKRNLTDIVKWVAAVAVVIYHLCIFYMHSPTLATELRFGSLSVSIFFFLSGYGLIYSYSLKGEKYLKSFLVRRMSKITIPLLTAYAIYIPLLRIINNREGVKEAILSLFSFEPLLPYSWYVTEIILLYLFFYITMRFIPKYKLIILSLTITCMMIGLLLAKQPHWWVNATPCFIIGIWYYQYECAIMKYMRKIRFWHLLLLILLFFCIYRLDIIQNNIQSLSRWRYTYASYYIVNYLFIILAVYIFQGINNIKSFKIKRNSYYEIYLMQGSVFLLLDTTVSNRILFFALAIITTILFSLGMNWVNLKITSLLKI